MSTHEVGTYEALRSRWLSEAQHEEFHHRMMKDNQVLNGGYSNHGYMRDFHKENRLKLEAEMRRRRENNT